MTSQLEEITQREAKATPGPWGGYHIGLHIPGGSLEYHGLGRQVQLWRQDADGPIVFDSICVCEIGLHRNDEANAEFIAHSRQDIPYLLNELLGLRRRLEAAEKVIAYFSTPGMYEHSPYDAWERAKEDTLESHVLKSG